MRDVNIQQIGKQARAAAARLVAVPSATKRQALEGVAAALRAGQDLILQANAADVRQARADNRPAAFLDRLTLDGQRVGDLATAVQAIAAQPDPVGTVLETWARPNGLHLQKIRVPIGVVGMIYEARPNVTVDAACLCLLSGNACILRTGREALQTATVLTAILTRALDAAGIPAHAVQLIPTADRAAVTAMLRLERDIDVIIPRGGRGLIEHVAANTTIPVLKHLDGNCHVYLDRAADPAIARRVTLNAKLRRTGICGAAESLLIHRDIAEGLGAEVVAALIAEGCAVRGDAAVRALHPAVLPATEEDWAAEYLSRTISACVVDDLAAAVAHINRYGSRHTDCIITSDGDAQAAFCQGVDSAIVMHNTSTQFADGGEFGFGAEIGIATGRLHARGPVGAQHLTTYKYVVSSDGAIRPV